LQKYPFFAIQIVKLYQNMGINYLWEIPLALLSFLGYKIAKFIIGNIYTIYLSIEGKIASHWRVVSQALIDAPLSLPVLMTKAPRWNTHAIISTLGPFAVQEYLEIDLLSPCNSAQSWIAIFYSFPDYQTVMTIEGETRQKMEQWQKIALKTGKYTIGLRYYNFHSENLILPAVKIDGRDWTEVTQITAESNSFYDHLLDRSNWFYLCLHYYIFTILKLRQYLPESFIANEYLPVGATDTFFAYDYLSKGKKLQIQVFPSFFNDYELYLTFYNRASFPVAWLKLDPTSLTTEKFIYDKHQENLSYLIRIRHKQLAAKDFLHRLSAIYANDENWQYLEIQAKKS
jgi:hypothetical protein